jgi:hypothetical protein
MVADDLLLDAARSHEVRRRVDLCNDDPGRLVIGQVTRLGQDDDPGLLTNRLITLIDLPGLVLPEHERAVVEDITLRQSHDAVLGAEFFEALVHDLFTGETVRPPRLVTKEATPDLLTTGPRDVPRPEDPLIQDEGTREALRPMRLGRAVFLRSFSGRLLDEERSQGLLDEGPLGRELPALDLADQGPLKVVREDDVRKVQPRHRSTPYFAGFIRPSYYTSLLVMARRGTSPASGFAPGPEPHPRSAAPQTPRGLRCNRLC